MRGHENAQCLLKRGPSQKPPSGWMGVNHPSLRAPLSNCARFLGMSKQDPMAEVMLGASRVKRKTNMCEKGSHQPGRSRNPVTDRVSSIVKKISPRSTKLIAEVPQK